jgi:hypothetical protein
MDDLEGQLQSFHAFLVEAAPRHRAAQITSVRRRFRNGEGLGAIAERFPVRETRALLLHVKRVPPLLDRQHPGFPEILDISGGDGLVQRLLAGGRPHFHGDVQVTRLQAGELRQVIRLHIIHSVSGLLQHFPHDPGADQLAGPVVQGQLYRIARFLRPDRQGGKRGDNSDTGPQKTARGHETPPARLDAADRANLASADPDGRE